jgi:twinkle protein
MMPEDEPVTMAMVENEMEAAVFHNDCQVFVLDPWNEVEHAKNRGETETEYIERSLRNLLRKTRRLNLLLIIAAHPTKLNDGGKPILYNISGSANWKNKCQHGIIIHKPSESSNGVEITVEKSKDWETMGFPGTVWMDFSRERCNYFPVL